MHQFCRKSKIHRLLFVPHRRRNGDFIMFETLKKLLVEELQVKEEAITLDAELSSDLGINSIELADLVMLCEDRFNLSIEDEDLHGFITVGDVVNYLESQN